ncbi:low molecular weight phosphatase family protein [Microbacterium shaanxiense]
MNSLPFGDPPAGISRREWRRRTAGASTPASMQGSAALPGLFASAESTDEQLKGARPTILIVCTGNICRSPMAEILLRRSLDSLGVRVHSAGTQALVGYEMTTPAQEIAIKLGADPDAASAHRARYLIEPLLFDSDLILTMTVEQRERVVQMAPRVMKRTFTVPEFARLAAGMDAAMVRGDASISPAARLRNAAVLVNDRRMLSPAREVDDDVIDPYRRDRAVYEQSASQITPGLHAVQRITTAALR